MIFCFFQHVSCFICVSSLNPFVDYVLCHVSCLDLCSHMFICLDLHAQRFMPYFSMFCSFFCSMLMLGLHVHMLDIMSMVMSCLDLHVCMHVQCSYGQILVFTCLYAWIHVLPCLCAKFLHVYMYVSIPICLDLCFHMSMCLDLCSLHVLCYIPCACVLHVMFVCLDLGYVCHAMCYCSPFVTLSFFLVFWPNGQDSIQTLWSLSLYIHQGPYQRFWVTLFACLCLIALMLYASVSLLVQGFATLDALSWFVVVWLHPTSMRPCLDVTTWDASP